MTAVYPQFDIEVTDVRKGTLQAGVYDIEATLQNPSDGTISSIIRSDGTPMVMSGNSFTDTDIQLPTMEYYVVSFTGQPDTTISVSVSDFATPIQAIILNNALNVSRRPESPRTNYGMPILDIFYDGPKLATWADEYFADEVEMIPYILDFDQEIDDLSSYSYVSAGLSSIPMIDNIASSSLVANGESLEVTNGYTYLMKVQTDAVRMFNKVYIHMKRASNVGGTFDIVVHQDYEGSVHKRLAVASKSHSDIPETAGWVEFELTTVAEADIMQSSSSLNSSSGTIDTELTLQTFWVEIRPSDEYAVYNISYTSEGYTSNINLSRYSRIALLPDDLSIYQGYTYDQALTSILNVVLSTSDPDEYPILFTNAETVVDLNRYFLYLFDGHETFAGPAIVTFPTVSKVQIGPTEITYGPSGKKTTGELVATVNISTHYEGRVLTSVTMPYGGLYTEYLVPVIDGDALKIETAETPNNCDRKVIFKTAALYIKYVDDNLVGLEPSFEDTDGEWRAVVRPGFMSRPLSISQVKVVETQVYETVTDIQASYLLLDGIPYASTQTYYLNEANAHPVKEHGETPAQIAENMFKVSKRPLYVDPSTDEPLFTMRVGTKLTEDITSSMIDFDIHNGILIFSRKVKFDVDKYIKYHYVEENHIVANIDLKDYIGSYISLYLSPSGEVAAFSETDELIGYNNKIYMLVGTYHITEGIPASDIEITDVRKRGGGVIENKNFDEAYKDNPNVVGFNDIGYNDGKNIPHVFVEVTMEDEVKEQFTEREISNVIGKHVAIGTKIYQKFEEPFEASSSSSSSSSNSSSS